jgi:hypothetical protein
MQAGHVRAVSRREGCIRPLQGAWAALSQRRALPRLRRHPTASAARGEEELMRKKDELSKERTCLRNAHPEEMVFVLLSRDAAAPVAIHAWVNERVRIGKNSWGDDQIVEALACARTMESEGRRWANVPEHYPPGMGEESRRLHREYNALVEAQRNGAKNGRDVVRLTNECDAKGIILVPGGENL